MPLLEVDEDVYQHILRNTIRIGEDASCILRRLLSLPESNEGAPGTRTNGNINPRVRDLNAFLASSRFIGGRNATGRFLLLLSFVCDQNPGAFEEILGLRGRNRVYLGRTFEEVRRSGKTLHPQRIPGTEFWAMTNASTAQKQDIIREVLRLLGFSEETVGQAAKALD